MTKVRIELGRSKVGGGGCVGVRGWGAGRGGEGGRRRVVCG